MPRRLLLFDVVVCVMEMTVANFSRMSPRMPPARRACWTTRGFDAFRAGTCGNAGHNLYVSRAGILQRIHQYDLNRDGYLDLIFCNSQNHDERPPATVVYDPLGERRVTRLPADGAMSAIVADLNGDGRDDIVLGNWYGGVDTSVNAHVYYGDASGWGERRSQRLPAPWTSSVAAGDFNGDGRVDLAFVASENRVAPVRIFYQTDIGFEPRRYIDTSIRGQQVGAADLDGDGCAELIVRDADGTLRIYWGGPDGIDETRLTVVPLPAEPNIETQAPETAGNADEYVSDARPLVKAITLNGVPHLFAPQRRSATLLPCLGRDTFGAPIVLGCHDAMSIAVGDFDGDGQDDLVIACRESAGTIAFEQSWIYWGCRDGSFTDKNRSPLTSHRACDVAAGDLNNDGRAEIVLCLNNDGDEFTTDSLIYACDAQRRISEPTKVQTHDARRVFIAWHSPDARPSVVFANFRSRNKIGAVQPAIYWGGPDGFSPDDATRIDGRGALEAICADFDDDGQVDLALANCSENSVSRDPGSYVFYQRPSSPSPGTGEISATPSVLLPTRRAHGVACADLNRDGWLDLIFCGFSNDELTIFHGSKDGFSAQRCERIKLHFDGVVYNDPRWLYLADLNNDGWLDLIIPMVGHDRSFILWGGPDGFSNQRYQALSVDRGLSVKAVDFTGNGYLDLILGGGPRTEKGGPHDSFVHIYWNGPEGLRDDRKTVLPANHVNGMAVADFNNDGRLDLFVESYSDRRVRDLDSYIYWNRGGGVPFSELHRTRLFTHSASGCFAADFNEDGYIDLAVANHKVWGDHEGYSEIWWNGPNGFDAKRTTRLPTSGPHGMTQVGPGNIADRGPEEYFTSAPHECDEACDVISIEWDAELPPKSWVRAHVRAADSREALDRTPWRGPIEKGEAIKNLGGRWIQYRLALGAHLGGGASPRVSEVRVWLDEQEE